VLADKKNLTWINTGNNHVVGFLRAWDEDRVYCVFNFSNQATGISWYTFKQNNLKPVTLFDHWSEKTFSIGYDHEHLSLQPYQFLILEPK
jgi:amylosucrase